MAGVESERGAAAETLSLLSPFLLRFRLGSGELLAPPPRKQSGTFCPLLAFSLPLTQTPGYGAEEKYLHRSFSPPPKKKVRRHSRRVGKSRRSKIDFGKNVSRD